MQYRHPHDCELDQILGLWSACFPEDTPQRAADYLAAMQAGTPNLWVAAEQGRVCAQLLMVPYTLALRGCPVAIESFAAVCTAPEMRGRGLAAGLMQAAIRDAAQRGVAALFLHTQLPAVYHRMGFLPATQGRRWQVTPSPAAPVHGVTRITTADPVAHLPGLMAVHNAFTAGQLARVARSEQDWQRYVRSFLPYNAQWRLAFLPDGRLGGYAIVEEDITEAAWIDPTAAAAVLDGLAGRSVVLPASLTPAPELPLAGGDRRVCNMLRGLNPAALCRGLQAGEDGSLVLQLTDAQLGNSLWRFEVANGRLYAQPTQARPMAALTPGQLMQWLAGYPLAPLPAEVQAALLNLLPAGHSFMFETM